MTPGILYIEDDLDVQRAIARMLRINYPQFQVYIIDSAPRAIAMLERNQFDLVISDYNIIGGTGGDVLAWLQANKPAMVARFIFLAGADEIEKHTHWLKKPVEMPRLRELIDHVLRESDAHTV